MAGVLRRWGIAAKAYRIARNGESNVLRLNYADNKRADSAEPAPNSPLSTRVTVVEFDMPLRLSCIPRHVPRYRAIPSRAPPAAAQGYASVSAAAASPAPHTPSPSTAAPRAALFRPSVAIAFLFGAVVATAATVSSYTDVNARLTASTLAQLDTLHSATRQMARRAETAQGVAKEVGVLKASAVRRGELDDVRAEAGRGVEGVQVELLELAVRVRELEAQLAKLSKRSA